MIRPHYIVCSESRIVDRTTGLVTHYNVLEQLTVGTTGRSPAGVGASPILKFVMTAVWMRDQEEVDDATYEFETRMHFPGEDEARCVHTGDFQFGSHRFHRLELHFQGALVSSQDKLPEGAILTRAGTLRLESRARRTGEREWMSQEYLIPLQVDEVSPELAESSQNNAEE